MKKLFHLLFIFMSTISVAQKQVLVSGNVHLRDGVKREWSSFPMHAKDSQLVIHFKTYNVSNSKTLALTQTDVNHSWKVIVNDKAVGHLELDEKKMDAYYSLPAHTLNENDNTLIIRSESMNAPQPDDIFIGNITLYNKSTETLMSESSLNIHSGIPSRLTILNENSSLQPIKAIAGDTLAIRCGVIYSGTGNISFSLPAGKYKIYASRGFEYGVDSAVVALRAGQKLSKNLTPFHEVKPESWTSVDTHVHTLEYSGHGDASMKERILTIAGEGLDYAVITEHNKVIDIAGEVKKMNMDRWFTPVAGDELTTGVGHFVLFPSTSAPSAEVHDWAGVKENISQDHGVK